MKEREKRSEKSKMVARVSNTPRWWPPPPPSLSSSQFRSLLHRRSLALSRLSSPPPPSHDDTEDDAKEKEDNHSVLKEEQQQKVEEEEKEEGELVDSDSTDNPSHLDLPLPLPVKKEEEILNAEEEMKRRINPSTVTCGSGGPDTPSASRLGLSRMSVVVNFGTDLGRESDPGSDAEGVQSTHTRPFCQMQSPSPFGSSLSRSPFSHNPRAPQASSSLLGNPLTSPAHFVPPTGQLGHVSSLPPLLPLPGNNFTAPSPSPAASGGAPSVFRDSRFGSSS